MDNISSVYVAINVRVELQEKNCLGISFSSKVNKISTTPFINFGEDEWPKKSNKLKPKKC